MKKYASDVVTSPDDPLRIVDKRTGSIIVIDNIVKYDDYLIFHGYFDEGGLSITKRMEYDSVVNVDDGSDG